ncbi:MAG TPA: co-chaperone GroES [Coriobacteriia bacterium]
MSLKPLGDRVIVKTDEAETQTASGLILADTAKEKPQRGKVIAVGEGKVNEKGERVPVDVKVGDAVIYSKYGGTEVKLEGEEFMILRAEDIYAIVEG